MFFHLTLKSRNEKTGPIPVSTSGASTCPDACPLKKSGCYADGGHVSMFWRKVTSGAAGTDLAGFVLKVSMLPEGTLWRHDQAGDLPGGGDAIDADGLGQIVAANAGKRGFTFTHKPVLASETVSVELAASNREAVAAANEGGFTVNLSANTLAHADALADLGIGPVAVVLPADIHGNMKLATPDGRAVRVCPATYSDTVTCKTCQLCQRQSRKVIVGFPAHGNGKAAADMVARG
jgi:hypothetical protein